MSELKTRISKGQVLGSGPAEGGACLVLIYPPGPDLGRTWPLVDNDLVLGRGEECDVIIYRAAVSRRHARVFREGSDWFVEDLGSTNGSYVNDVPIQSCPLRDSDLVKAGSAILKYLSSSIETAFHEEMRRRMEEVPRYPDEAAAPGDVTQVLRPTGEKKVDPE